VATLEQLAPYATAWAGTSIGAVHAAAGASRVVGRVRAMWESVTGVGTFQSPNLPDIWNGVYKLGPLRKMMERTAALHPVDPMWVGCWDYGRGTHELVSVHGDEERVWRCVQASASQPGIHEAVELDGRWVGDGGIWGPLPPVPPGQWDEVHAVFCVPTAAALPWLEQDSVSSALEQADRALDFFVQARVVQCRKRLQKYRERNPQTRVFVYEPASWSVVGPTFDARPAAIRRRLKHGEWMASRPVEL
jgi:predicted acylesterase/phospholipase RssA